MSRGVLLDEQSARRMERVTIAYERGNRDAKPIKFRTVADEDETKFVGKFAGTWNKGETKTITVWRKTDGVWGETDEEYEVENLQADVSTPNESSFGWVTFSFRGGAYVMDTFECGVAEA